MVFGITLVVRPAAGGNISPGFMEAITHKMGNVPVITLIVIIVFIIGEVLLIKTRLGTSVYSTGSSQESARVAGIRVDRVRVLVYVFSGTMAAIAGLILAARIGSGDPQSGTNFTLLAVTAAVVGGTSIFGGRGTMFGTFAGSVLIIEMQNALNLLRVSAYYQYIWIGVLTLIAISIYSLREKKSGSGKVKKLFVKKSG
jgi:ribose/xylose/arabinose/galactoside ABC-type transport system permease subunit